MGFFNLFRKKKNEQSVPKQQSVQPKLQARRQQEITDEQAERMAHALSQYLKDSK